MIEWVLKSALWLTLFWCVWKLLLSRETFYKFNRQYLAAALILSLILPAVQLHYVREIKSVPVELQFTEVETTTSPAITTAPVVDESASRLDWMVLVLACYATGVLIMATGVVRRGIRIRGIIRKHGYTQYDGYRIVEVAGSTPFSVGRYIFLDSAMSEAEREIIISHELAHIRGRHRLDLLLAGAVCAIQWFNPFARLTMRAVRDNHEYIADTAVLANGCSRAIYKATLINSALGDRVFTLGHTFAGSGKNNLKRYTMMNRKNSHNARKLAVFALLPIAAIILAAFAKPRYVISQNTETIRPDTTGVTKLSYSGQPDNIDILQRLGYDKTNSAGYLLILDDHEVSVDKINALDLQKITAATVLRHEAAEPYGALGKNGVLVIETESNNPGHGTIDTIRPTSAIVFNGNVISAAELHTRKIGNSYGVAYFPDMADLIKDPEQVRKLRAEGKRGAVQINEYGKPDEKTVGDVRVISGSELLSASSATVISALRNIDPILLAEESSKKIPLIIIDDKEVPLEELIELDENKVQSITLLKDAAATERYGKRAKNGVIVVKTQKEETIATTRINYLSEMRVVKAKNEGAITTAAKSNDLDYTKVNVTYKHGKYYNPDGVEVPERNVFGVMDYNGRFLSNKDLKIANGFKHSSKSSRLHSIEANEKETRVTFICEIYWDHNWLFVDRDACLIDPKTGDNYMIRDIEGVQEVGRMYIVSGLKGRFVEQTMIFPPLQKGVEKIDYYEPANYIDIPDSDTNGGGLTIKNININDYSPKKKGRVIR